MISPLKRSSRFQPMQCLCSSGVHETHGHDMVSTSVEVSRVVAAAKPKLLSHEQEMANPTNDPRVLSSMLPSLYCSTTIDSPILDNFPLLLGNTGSARTPCRTCRYACMCINTLSDIVMPYTSGSFAGVLLLPVQHHVILTPLQLLFSRA